MLRTRHYYTFAQVILTAGLLVSSPEAASAAIPGARFNTSHVEFIKLTVPEPASSSLSEMSAALGKWQKLKIEIDAQAKKFAAGINALDQFGDNNVLSENSQHLDNYFNGSQQSVYNMDNLNAKIASVNEIIGSPIRFFPPHYSHKLLAAVSYAAAYDVLTAELDTAVSNYRRAKEAYLTALEQLELHQEQISSSASTGLSFETAVDDHPVAITRAAECLDLKKSALTTSSDQLAQKLYIIFSELAPILSREDFADQKRVFFVDANGIPHFITIVTVQNELPVTANTADIFLSIYEKITNDRASAFAVAQSNLSDFNKLLREANVVITNINRHSPDDQPELNALPQVTTDYRNSSNFHRALAEIAEIWALVKLREIEIRSHQASRNISDYRSALQALKLEILKFVAKLNSSLVNLKVVAAAISTDLSTTEATKLTLPQSLTSTTQQTLQGMNDVELVDKIALIKSDYINWIRNLQKAFAAKVNVELLKKEPASIASAASRKIENNIRLLTNFITRKTLLMSEFALVSNVWSSALKLTGKKNFTIETVGSFSHFSQGVNGQLYVGQLSGHYQSGRLKVGIALNYGRIRVRLFDTKVIPNHLLTVTASLGYFNKVGLSGSVYGAFGSDLRKQTPKYIAFVGAGLTYRFEWEHSENNYHFSLQLVPQVRLDIAYSTHSQSENKTPVTINTQFLHGNLLLGGQIVLGISETINNISVSLTLPVRGGVAWSGTSIATKGSTLTINRLQTGLNFNFDYSNLLSLIIEYGFEQNREYVANSIKLRVEFYF